MTEPTIDIRVPGSAYFEALDPMVTGVPGELELPDPTRKARGKGWTYTYEGLTIWQAEEVADHLIDHGETILSGGSIEDSAERSSLTACIETGRRIAREAKAAAAPACDRCGKPVDKPNGTRCFACSLKGATSAGILNTETGRISR